MRLCYKLWDRLSLLLYLGARRVRPVAILVQSPLSIDTARRAIIASTQDGPSAFDFGQCAIYGTVEDDTFDLRVDQGEERQEVPAGFIRGTLQADGRHVRVYALVSEAPTPIVLWLFVLAFPFMLLWVALMLFYPGFGFGSAGRSIIVGLLYAVTVFLVFRIPTRPSDFIVTKAKDFLSRALLAEAIEVEASATASSSSTRPGAS